MFARNLTRAVTQGGSAFLKCSPKYQTFGAGSWVKCFSSKSDTQVKEGYKYTEKHEWISVDGNISTIGVTDYAQDQLGDIVYAQLPDVGAEFEKGDDCGALESVKAASELYTPISGTVTDTNPNVEDKPSLINTSCYDDGWLVKIEMSKPEELNDLMEAEQYKKFVKAQLEDSDN